MSFDIDFDRERNLLIVTLRGVFTIQEFQATMEQISKSEQYPPNTDALWDLRELDFENIDAGYWKRILGVRGQYPSRKAARLAHVVTGDFAFGMLRMYQIHSELHPHPLQQQIGVFKSIADAEQWLLSQ